MVMVWWEEGRHRERREEDERMGEWEEEENLGGKTPPRTDGGQTVKLGITDQAPNWA